MPAGKQFGGEGKRIREAEGAGDQGIEDGEGDDEHRQEEKPMDEKLV